MTLYYKHFTATGHPKGMTSFVITNNSWKVYLLCETNDVRSCYIFIDRTNLQVKDLSKFKTMFRQLGSIVNQECLSLIIMMKMTATILLPLNTKERKKSLAYSSREFTTIFRIPPPRKTNYFITCLGQTHR